MEQVNEPLVVGVRFSKVGKIYHFIANDVNDIKVGDQVVVETSRGWQLGQVAQIIPNPEQPPEGWKPIDRRATPRDLLLRQMWQMKEAEVITSCRAKATDLKLVGIKIISAEYSFDGSRLTIFFSSETEEKYDLKSLRSDMQKLFAPSQVEMRQIGPRDVAKTVCGMGACGLETRCCCLFLTEFSSISIRMAKEQGISLTPTEITGMCGRLRCCLIYEYDTYVDARSKLPKRNKRVRTPQGDGKVVDIIPLRSSVVVELPEVGRREFTSSEIVTLDANGNEEQPRPLPPLRGTEQASEMDQAITGDTTEEPFEISGENPPPESPWETPPEVEKPRSMPAPQRPRPENQPRRGKPRRSGRGQQPGPGEDQSTGTKSPLTSRPQAPRRGNRPGRDNRPETPRSQAGQGENQGDQPKPPRNESGSGGAQRSGRKDQRRRKGPRRDTNDNEK